MIRVHVWNYGGFWKSCVGSTYNVGHAAVSVDTFEANQSVYISWWPGGGDPKKGAIGANEIADPHLYIMRDLVAETGAK